MTLFFKKDPRTRVSNFSGWQLWYLFKIYKDWLLLDFFLQFLILFLYLKVIVFTKQAFKNSVFLLIFFLKILVNIILLVPQFCFWIKKQTDRNDNLCCYGTCFIDCESKLYWKKIVKSLPEALFFACNCAIRSLLKTWSEKGLCWANEKDSSVLVHLFILWKRAILEKTYTTEGGHLYHRISSAKSFSHTWMLFHRGNTVSIIWSVFMKLCLRVLKLLSQIIRKKLNIRTIFILYITKNVSRMIVSTTIT